MQIGGVSTCLHIGWGRNWTVWEYRWRLGVDMWHSLCAAMYLFVGFFEVMLVLLVVMNCAELMWEFNCLVYIKSEAHVILFLLCIWCQYCYAILSSSCVCVFCNRSLKMTVKCQWAWFMKLGWSVVDSDWHLCKLCARQSVSFVMSLSIL